MEDVMDSKLLKIQIELKAPKNQKNSHAGYMYRSCEDILEAVKPLCQKYNCTLTLSDDIVFIGERVYVKSYARIVDNEKGSDSVIQVSAFAREQFNKVNNSGKEIMDHAQLTGSASSYSRKYALNGLFCIDDNKDADFHNDGKPEPKKEEKQKGDLKGALKAISESKTIENLDKICKLIELRIWTDEESKELDFANSDKRGQLK